MSSLKRYPDPKLDLPGVRSGKVKWYRCHEPTSHEPIRSAHQHIWTISGFKFVDAINCVLTNDHGGWGCVLYRAYVSPVMRASPSTCRMLNIDWQVRGLCRCLWYARRGLCLCPCVTTPRGFTSLSTGGGVYFFRVYSNKQTNNPTTTESSYQAKREHSTVIVPTSLSIVNHF